MKKIESYEDYRQNNAEILSAIKKVVVENNGDIYVPYMFDEDDYDEDDYQQLVEDEYRRTCIGCGEESETHSAEISQRPGQGTQTTPLRQDNLAARLSVLSRG